MRSEQRLLQEQHSQILKRSSIHTQQNSWGTVNQIVNPVVVVSPPSLQGGLKRYTTVENLQMDTNLEQDFSQSQKYMKTQAGNRFSNQSKRGSFASETRLVGIAEQ